nr:type III pantothenate kinase [Rubrobacter sp.]
SLRNVGAVIVSSDVPPLIRSYRRFAEDRLGVPFHSVSSEMNTGLDIHYDDPAALGSDRIVNSVAAVHYYGTPAIIVDFGTATTVEVVGKDANYLGGAMMPGVYISLDTLASRAAKLQNVDLEVGVPKAVATNTPDALRSGFIFGYAGAVDSLIRRFRDELAASESIDGLQILATGGPAPAIVPHCHEIRKLDPDLTLKGLRVLHEMNAG